MNASPSPVPRNVAVASAARIPAANASGYAQLPGGGPMDVPQTPGARQYTGMPVTNAKPTSSGCTFFEIDFRFLFFQLTQRCLQMAPFHFETTT
jgi:hypothetical protein